MECKNEKKAGCPCTYSCAYHGLCCKCVANHAPDELPACYFSKSAEKRYDRSVGAYLKDRGA